MNHNHHNGIGEQKIDRVFEKAREVSLNSQEKKTLWKRILAEISGQSTGQAALGPIDGPGTNSQSSPWVSDTIL
ncbi:MAG: hypothetical protein KGJ33_01155 [Patescibacteria group bacterium]|nr:hypothetical protein [Patescibacteria group bacterium]